MRWLWRELGRALVPSAAAAGIAGIVGTVVMMGGAAATNPAGVSPAGTMLAICVISILGIWFATLGTVILRLPLYLLIRRVGFRMRWWSAMLLGAAVALAPISFIMMPIWRSFMGDHPMPDWTMWDAISPAIPFILGGASGGFTFWRLLPNGEARA